MTTQQLDFTACETKARGMSRLQLHGALSDIRRTLPRADLIDRTYGLDRGGYYRDEASVYHRELLRRGSKP